jgi:hypothetical protein
MIVRPDQSGALRSARPMTLLHCSLLFFCIRKNSAQKGGVYDDDIQAYVYTPVTLLSLSSQTPSLENIVNDVLEKTP